MPPLTAVVPPITAPLLRVVLPPYKLAKPVILAALVTLPAV